MKKITKLMLTLALLLVGVTGAKAAETTIYTMDYSTATSFTFWNGSPSDVSVGLENGLLVIKNTKVQEQTYTLQLHIGEGITTTEGNEYKVKIEYKATIEEAEGSNNIAWVAFGDWEGKSQTNYWVPLTSSNDYQTLNLDFNGDGDGFKFSGTSNFVMLQCGKIVGTIYIKKVEVIEVTPDAEPVWTNIIFNSDMEDSDDRCFYSKNAEDGIMRQGVITDGIGKDGSRGIKVTSVERTKTGEKDDQGNDKWTGYDWDAQFWIRLPQMLPAGTRFRVSFDYKATVPGRADTQSHAEPGDYIHWAAIGSPEFTEEWQSYSKVGTITSDMSNDGKKMHSVAFSLSCNHTATEFFFDNVKFEIDENDVTLPDFDYYLSGTLNSWTPSEPYKLVANPDTEGEYMINMDLEEGDEFKIVKGANEVWYPGTEGNYVVNESGNYTIYFRPSGNGGSDWYYGVIYLVHNYTYTATFTTNLGWNNVYAYAWTGDTYLPLGTWKGTEIFDTDDDGVYELSFIAPSAPANIIFHNGDGQQTSDLDFVDGKAYTWDLNYYVMSEDLFGSWDASEAGKMTKNTDGTYTLSMEGKELSSNQAYKVMKDLGGNTTWYPDGNNNVIGISMAGKYDIAITIDPANNYRITEAMSVYKDITAAGYATFFAPYALNFVGTGVQAYFAKYENGRVDFYEVFNAPKEQGLLLKADAGTYKLKMESVSGEAAADLSGNALKGVFEDTEKPAGIFVLLNGEKGVGFYKTLNAFTVGANTAYIEVPSEARFISLDGETTAIEGIAAEKINNGEVYNLNGQRVAQPTKGLYIVNGKKYVVK